MRTQVEKDSEELTVALFTACQDAVADKLRVFPKYVTRQSLARFLSYYELMRMVLPVEGSIVECGVFRGGGLMAWAKLSAILEPTNWRRQVVGFDTFEGFPSTQPQDVGTRPELVQPGQVCSNSYDELTALVTAFDKDRFLGHMPKVRLIRGDATKLIPMFVPNNPHFVVALLYLDFDLYEPTRVALQCFVPRMPLGGVLVFDNINHPYWPGETLAVDEVLGIGKLRIRRFPSDPSLCYAVKE